MISQPPQSSLARPSKPSNVQTNALSLCQSTAASIPASAVSTSSVTTASSVQASPIMSPESAQLTTNNSSIQGSPDALRAYDSEFVLPPFELPESIVSRKSSQSAMSEAMSQSKSPGLIRRISNRASKLAGRRRQSSTAQNNRDRSAGPVIMRRRSDSTNTVPEGINGPFYTDSDEESIFDLQEEAVSMYDNEGLRDFSSISSVGPSGSTGPVVPSILLQGTALTKVSKKKKKLLTFVLEKEFAKVSWDKSSPSKSFYIDDIKDIRAGANARTYRQEFGVPAADEARFFSIVYAVPDKSKGKAQKVMHLIANDARTFDMWVNTLDAISKHRHEYMQSLSSFHDKAVRTCWRTEMDKLFQGKPRTEEDESINFAGVEQLCRSLHIHGSTKYLQSRFEQADVSASGRLNFAEFQEFVNIMKRREDVRAIYQEHASDKEKGLSIEEFFRFLTDVQNEIVSAERPHWENVFAKFVRQSKTKEQAHQDALDGEAARMSESAFSSFLVSTFNRPVHNEPQQYSLDRPLNEYFISSSHNTYLLGRQVAGESSIEAYISALSKGCRCVEVDCWNGSEGPVVMHGRTLTSQVSFADVMSTISKYAFVKSSFPLWISLEVHCNPQQQAMMADIIKETCGSKLVTQPLDPSVERLPTPSQLMNRILIKVKKPRTFDASITSEPRVGRNRGNSLNSPYVRPLQLDNSLVSAGLLPSTPYIQPSSHLNRHNLKYPGSEVLDSTSSSPSDDDSTNADDVALAKDSKLNNKTSNIIKVLGELGVYSAGLKFRGFDDPESRTYNHIFSFMESTFDKHSKTPEEKRLISRHNMRHMMRIYPNGWRVSSTNFDPNKYWRRGVQMVALNWQTHDLGMQMNDAMFASGTDQSGYVLKPTELREIKMITTVPEEAGVGYVKRERKNVNFSIDIISAQQLMRPEGLNSSRSVDPYVEVEVYHADDKSKVGIVGEGGLDASSKDGSGLGSPHKRRTQIIQENGFNPIFNKKFNFALTTKFPELVFVRWTVKCSHDGFSYGDKALTIATYTAKLSGLKQGYRTIALLNDNGEELLFSTLFCRIKIDVPTSIYIDSPESLNESTNVLKSIGRSVWRNSPISPRSFDTNSQLSPRLS